MLRYQPDLLQIALQRNLQAPYQNFFSQRLMPTRRIPRLCPHGGAVRSHLIKRGKGASTQSCRNKAVNIRRQ